MKILLRAVLSCFVCASAFAQSEDELKVVATKVCQCIGERNVNLDVRRETEVALGLCILEVIEENKVAIEVTDQQAMEQFGQKVGIRMATVCPEVFKSFINEKLDEKENKVASIEVSGKVKQIEGSEIMALIVKEDNGKEHRLIWIHHFPGSDDFVSDPKSLVGKKVSATYRVVDIYSPKQKAYVTSKQLDGLKLE